MEKSFTPGGVTCKDCLYIFNDGAQNYCRRFPPTAQFVPSQGALGQVQLSLSGSYPPIHSSGYCGEWKPAAKEILPAKGAN
jgi:hypothetical protein